MAKYVTNPLKNAQTRYNEESLRAMQARRTGEWGRVNPEQTAAYKATQRRMAKSEEVRSGRYFPNTVVEKQVERNRKSLEAFYARKQQIDSQ